MVAAATGLLMHSKVEKANPALQELQTHKWATTIKSILPEDFELEDDYATKNATVDDLLSHRTGLAGADYMYGSWMSRDPKAIVRALRHLGPLRTPFRNAFEYNNNMYSVLGDVLKATTGSECGPVLKEKIWDPLGMESTFWGLDDVPEARRNDLSRGHFWVQGQSEATGYHVPEPYIDEAGIAPAGNTVSSANDYGKWVKELLSAASKDPKRLADRLLLTPELFSELTTPRTLVHGAKVEKNPQLSARAYALAWFIQTPVAGIDHPIVTHSGSLTGYGAEIFLLPNDDFGVATLSNSLWSKVVGELISLELMARKLGLTGEAKTRFIDILRTKMPEAPEDDEEDSCHPAAGRVERPSDFTDVAAEWYVGDYTHPAYGTFRVSRYENEKFNNVAYMPWVSQSERRKRNLARAQKARLAVAPVGKRTWKYQMLLHTREHDNDSSSHALSSGSHDHDGPELKDDFFDVEHLDGHGNVEDDKSPGFPTGAESVENQVANSDIRIERVWQSAIGVNQLGAVFQFEQRMQEHIPRRLGMRLGSDIEGTDGSVDPGWEGDMVWFVKKDQSD
jgi:CubicO group peptidase (beta-lactamase class C family)